MRNIGPLMSLNIPLIYSYFQKGEHAAVTMHRMERSQKGHATTNCNTPYASQVCKN